MKRGRPRKNKIIEEEVEVTNRKIKKLSEQEEKEEEVEEAAKKKNKKKGNKKEESKQPGKEKERRFEIQPIDTNEIFEYVMKAIEKDLSLKSIIKSSYNKFVNTFTLITLERYSS